MFLLFFGSGVCALVYETVWVRQLALSFGITIHAISAVTREGLPELLEALWRTIQTGVPMR